MEEIYSQLEKIIGEIKAQQEELKELDEKRKELKAEKKSLEKERDSISDSNSGFYADAQEKVDAKNKEFALMNTSVMEQESKLNDLLNLRKQRIIEQIEEKKKYIDENRNSQILEDKDKTLLAEKRELEKKIKEREKKEKLYHEMSHEEYSKVPYKEKTAFIFSLEEYKSNKERLKQVKDEIKANKKRDAEFVKELEGKDPLERYKELESMLQTINNGLTLDNIDNFSEEIAQNKQSLKQDKESKKIEDMKQQKEFEKALEEAQQRKEEREELINGMSNEEFLRAYTGDETKTVNTSKEFDPEEIKNMSKEEFAEKYAGKKPNEEIKEEEVKKEEPENKQDIERPKKVKKQVKPQEKIVKFDSNEIMRIFIDEEKDKVQITYRDKYGDIQKEGLKKGCITEVLKNKKAVFKEKKIKEKCRDLAGSRIGGWMLQRDINPVVVASMGLIEDEETLDNYIKSVYEFKNVDFEMVHDMRNSSLSFMEKVAMRRYARIEEEDLGQKVFKDSKLSTKLLKAAKAKRKLKNEPSKQKTDLKDKNNNLLDKVRNGAADKMTKWADQIRVDKSTQENLNKVTENHKNDKEATKTIETEETDKEMVE